MNQAKNGGEGVLNPKNFYISAQRQSFADGVKHSRQLIDLDRLFCLDFLYFGSSNWVPQPTRGKI